MEAPLCVCGTSNPETAATCDGCGRGLLPRPGVGDSERPARYVQGRRRTAVSRGVKGKYTSAKNIGWFSGAWFGALGVMTLTIEGNVWPLTFEDRLEAWLIAIALGPLVYVVLAATVSLASAMARRTDEPGRGEKQ